MRSAAKIAGALLVFGIFLTVAISRLPFTTVAPDSIRFMHFAQINADRAVAEGGTAKTALTAMLRTIKGMNSYDLNRGRLVQGLAFGIDAMSRWILPFTTLNVLMILILAINAALAARLATRDTASPDDRVNLAILAWLVMVTSALVLSPVMLLILYGKYVWTTFILAHFVVRRAGWKVFWLVPAAYADEIGLIAVALIVFLYVGRAMLNRAPAADGNARGECRAILLAVLTATGAALNVVLVFFGLSAIVFDAGAGTFSSFAARGAKGVVLTGQSTWDMAQGIFWRAEVFLLGLSTEVTAITTLIGLVGLGIIGFAFVRQLRPAIAATPRGWARTRAVLRLLVLNNQIRFYTYWIVLLIVIAWLVLPGRPHDLTHYSYPAAIVISLLVTKSIVDIMSVKRAYYVFGALAVLHLALVPRIADATTAIVKPYLLPDGTVTVDDLGKLLRSVEQFRATGKSALFDSINTGQEIDFSGTWYYSRVRWFGIATEPHWPVQGTVRVMAWPNRLPIRCVKRNFLYTRAEFVDKPCPGI